MKRRDVKVGKVYNCWDRGLLIDLAYSCKVIKKGWFRVLEEHTMQTTRLGEVISERKTYGHKWYWQIIEEF